MSNEDTKKYNSRLAEFGAGKRIALLIGSSEFIKDRKNLNTLKCPLNDIKGVAEILLAPDKGAFDVVKLFPNKPHYEVYEELELVLAEASRDDLVLIYYSGHGWTDFEGKLYLTFINTNTKTIRASAIKFDDLYDSVCDGAKQVRKIVIALDCCYAGAVKKSLTKGGAIQRELERLSNDATGTIIMTAAGENQTAKENPEEKYSIFTKHWINGILKSEADIYNKGIITANDLAQYVRQKVIGDNRQNPQFYGLKLQGDLIISKSQNVSGRQATIVRIQKDVGYGNSLYLRGNTPPLSWVLNYPGILTSGNWWEFNLGDMGPSGTFKFKGYTNNGEWQAGPLRTGNIAQTTEVGW